MIGATGDFLGLPYGFLASAVIFVLLMLLAQYLHEHNLRVEKRLAQRSSNGQDSAGEIRPEATVEAMNVSHRQALDDLTTQVGEVVARLSQVHASVLLFADLVGWPSIISVLDNMPRDTAARFIEQTLTWPVVFDKIRTLDRDSRAHLLRVLVRHPKPLAFYQVTDGAFILESATNSHQHVYDDASLYRSMMRSMYVQEGSVHDIQMPLAA